MPEGDDDEFEIDFDDEPDAEIEDVLFDDPEPVEAAKPTVAPQPTAVEPKKKTGPEPGPPPAEPDAADEAIADFLLDITLDEDE